MPQATDERQLTTIGEQVRRSDAVREGVAMIVDEIKARQSEITEVRPASPELKKNLEDLQKRTEASRGRALMAPYVGSGIGAGALVELVDGSIKYDMTCGIGPNFFGHSDPDLIATAIEAATGDVVMQGYFQQNADAILFTETLVREAGRNSELRHAFLCNSGAMANDNALKVAYQKHHPADRVIAFKDCFMGRSIAMSQIGDNAAYRVGLPTTIDIDYMPFYSEGLSRRMSAGDVSGVTRQIDMAVWHLRQYIERYPKQHAAFVFELVQGEGGYNTAPREYFTALMDVCKDQKIAVWIDEIQTFGRTSEMFCFDTMNLGSYVDLCTVGKMTQVCAALFTPDYNPKPGLLSGTFLGSTVGLNVGRRIVERLREGGLYGDGGAIARHRRIFNEQVKRLAASHPAWFPAHPDVPEPFGGLGGMMRLTPFAGDRDKIMKLCKACFDEGIVALYCGHGPYHVRMLPPLGVMREEEWPKVFQLLERAMAKVAGA